MAWFTALGQWAEDGYITMTFKHTQVRIPVSVAFALSPKDTKPNPKFVSKVWGWSGYVCSDLWCAGGETERERGRGEATSYGAFTTTHQSTPIWPDDTH